ncbi:multicopper oxidase family protein [Streptomyces sp. PKU-MA01144]|uniref:multicopper oxidase family protein n=1 Tax=Streptomyces sp. PKU-MA01144 TaxID=2729138 RepID=UPI001481900E|nr:multicopper oxidase family protein [Streptomyces sp. PKU-MA01144]NNJ05915.1 multicopper oxidase family protein [Streptomyces sp. PKU-MA01144]
MSSQEHTRQTSPTRRAVLGAGIAAVGSGLLTACSGGGSDDRGRGAAGAPAQGSHPTDGGKVGGPAAEGSVGPLRTSTFTATPGTVDIGRGRTFRTWTYDGRLPGKEVRINEGDTLALTLANHLPAPTTVHWHGIAIENEMDGVPDVTQPAIKPGGTFAYRFTVPHAGTHWFHPHYGVQIDRGMYAPLIVEDPREPLLYDHEWVIVLDDWVDGVDGSTPDDVLAQLLKGKPAMGHGNGHDRGHGGGDEERDRERGREHENADADADDGSGDGERDGRPRPRPTGGVDAGYGPASAHEPDAGRGSPGPAGGRGPNRLTTDATSKLLGGHAGDVAYPYYLINGRTADHPTEFKAKPGDRIRLRIINAGAETAFRVALGGHEMTVVHSDGFPVHPYKTDALLLGMAERYDVLVTAKDGVFPFTALAEGKRGSAMAVLRTGGGATPKPSTRPSELDRRVLQSSAYLRPKEQVALDRRRPDRLIRFTLTGGMKRYDWAFDRRPYDPETLHRIEYGERVRLVVINATDMWHPMHLHGHTFALAGIDSLGARKDTAILLPHRKLVADFDADNPGLWMFHCHNIYHSESGMMTTLTYKD